jgi:CcmD family protein
MEGAVSEFLSQNALYIVLIIAVVVWGGVFAYLYRMDTRLARLERESKQ